MKFPMNLLRKNRKKFPIPGVNFMSQKLREIHPGGIFVLTLIGSFQHFFGLNVCLLSSFEETVTLKLSRIYSQGEKKGESSN